MKIFECEKKVIWLFFILQVVVISSVQAIPYFSTIDAIDLLGTNSTNPLPEKEASIIPFSQVLDIVQDHGGNNITGQVQNDELIEHLLQGNQKFRNDIYNANIERNQELVSGQNPGVLWIGCSDSRSDPESITSAEPGELFVTRNVGNIVPYHDWSMAAVLEYSINYLNVQEIIICGHSDCGAIKALDKNLNDPYISLWLNDASEAKTRVDSRISIPTTPDEIKERYHQIELENVRLQVEHLMTYPSVKTALNEGKLHIRGLYYDLSNGTLSVVT
jgi:carbonic anhydrase